MHTFIALLRGINVSGHKPIRMADLQACLHGLGLSAVRTYLQSGNVIFCSEQTQSEPLAVAIHEAILHRFGHEVEVLVVPGAAWQAMVRAMPFVPKSEDDEKLFHLTFLFQPVGAAAFAAIAWPAGPQERLELIGPVVYLHCPGGYGKTKLSNTLIEKKLAMPATTRGWRSVCAISALLAPLVS